MNNEMKMEFDAISENEGFARMAVAAFVMGLNPTLEELSDIKTAVSEAVTNAIIHGYGNLQGYEKNKYQSANEEIKDGKVYMKCRIVGDVLFIDIMDKGAGIPDLEKAMEPLYTTKPELDRSGMGFAFMEAFMDDLEVESEVGKGTKIHMIKKIGATPWVYEGE
mgnify:FL=1